MRILSLWSVPCAFIVLFIASFRETYSYALFTLILFVAPSKLLSSVFFFFFISLVVPSYSRDSSRRRASVGACCSVSFSWAIVVRVAVIQLMFVLLFVLIAAHIRACAMCVSQNSSSICLADFSSICIADLYFALT